MFNDLLRSSLNYVNEKSACDIVNTFMEDKFEAFKVHGSCVQYMMMVLVTGALLIFSSSWNVIIVFLMLSMQFYIYRSLKYTIVAMHGIETSSRRRMLRTFSNTLNGRAVIQAFEKLDEFRNE